MHRAEIAKGWSKPIALELARLATARAGSANATLRLITVLLGVAFLGFITLLVVNSEEPIAEGFTRITGIIHQQAAPRVERAGSPTPAPMPRVVTGDDLPNARGVQQAARTGAPLPMVQRPGERGPMPVVVRPSAPVGGHIVVAHRSSNGHFFFDAETNGAHVRMMFDTGATVVALRPEDAQHMGVDLSTLVYSARTSTANGTATAAPYTIEQLTIGDITVTQVPAMIARRGALSVSLLGQSFMAKLVKYNVEGDDLTFEGR